MASTNPANNVVLNSWKEIANHVGRGVRTVQRWERDLGMPVRRPRAKSRSAVVAMTDEIDAWLRSAPKSEVLPQCGPRVLETSRMILSLRQAVEQHVNLRDECYRLHSANQEALAELVAQLQMMTEFRRANGTQGISESAPLPAA